MNKTYLTPIVMSSLAVFLMAISGCHPAYKATATKAMVRQELCAEQWLLFPDQPHPLFEEVPGLLKDMPAEMNLPKKYIRYRVNADTLRALFTSVKTSGKKTGIIFPVNRQCEPFELHLSGSMATSLQDKYPEVVSVQGQGVNNKASDIRLDWNGKQMRGQITFNGEVFYILGLTDNNETNYLVYNREDTGEVKKAFETTPVKTNTDRVYYDR